MGKKLKLKVCGMRDPKNMMDVAALNPDFMGFIFYLKSKRYVGAGFSIPKDFPKDIKKVGVFVTEKTETILEKIALHGLDFVQLHGDESPEDCRALREKVKVIKVFSVDEKFDFGKTETFVPYSDFFMFDTKSREYGGTGIAFDWQLLKKYDQSLPFFLSGGLSLENIADASELRGLNLFALDINSRAESEPGVKDIRILSTLFQKINSLQNEIHR